MLEWIKDKLIGTKNDEATVALRAEFQPWEKLPGAKQRLADRLARFVLDGRGEDVIVELAAMQDTHKTLELPHGGGNPEKGLPSLVKILPQDPELFLRLGRVYAAARNPGGRFFSTTHPSSGIPAFRESLSWLGTFLIQLSRNGGQKNPIFPVNLILRMLELVGEDSNVLIKGAFCYEDAYKQSYDPHPYAVPYTHFRCLSGFAELARNSPGVIKLAFQQKLPGSRAFLLRALVEFQIPPDPFAEEIVTFSVSKSKEVRESSLPLITQSFSTFKQLLEGYAEKGSADERFHAVSLLAQLGGESEQTFFSKLLERETSAKVSEVIQETLSGVSAEQADVEAYALSPVPDIPVHAPLPQEVLVYLRQIVAEIDREASEKFNRSEYAQKHGTTRTPFPPETADQIFDLLQNLVITKDTTFTAFVKSPGVDITLLDKFTIPPQFQLIHLVRWCALISALPEGQLGNIDLYYVSRAPIMSYQKVHEQQIDLREFAAAIRAVGFSDLQFGRHLFLQGEVFGYTPLLRSEPDKIWPYFAERLDLLEEALELKEPQFRTYADDTIRQNAFTILKMFPRVPSRFVGMLWDLALGPAKTERPVARECLDKFPDKEQKIIAALASRKQDTRLAAAQWLAELKYKEAIPALRQALSKEKSEIVKEELIKALDASGIKLDELLDTSKLDEEASKGLKKGIPNDLEWFPFAQLPLVRWADSGEPVSTEILQWFLVQGYKLKNPEANPTLRQYCSLFQKEDRERLGKFVLVTWIAEDIKLKYTGDQAAAEAKRLTQESARRAQRWGDPPIDEQQVYQTNFNRLVDEPGGSQISTKGILAVAGACCGGEVAPVVHHYIKQWFGHRAPQCKALLQVLAWIDDPSAIQVILSIAIRFRTKNIQEEALRQCELIAERKGWTMDELADRTVPTASLDESGSMELDYGSRKFAANLSEEMTIAVMNEKGKVISSLPDANQSDDAEKVKLAKATLSDARKELKSVLAMQKDRLYEALCTQRTWRFEDWDTYLRQHPIVGRYCQRLVWVAYDGERVIESFRPLADGTLTNHHDDEVTLKPDTAVQLGHDETLPAEDRTAWLQHFSDYEVEPLFQQFGKATFTLPDAMKDAHEIEEFVGYIIKAFSLRSRLTKLGYNRGPVRDNGCFWDYRKTFVRLGIQAVIEFTGICVPEENLDVALKKLYFIRKEDEDVHHSTLTKFPLSELPPVLLAECWNDIRTAAADGPGFAADWKKQFGQ